MERTELLQSAPEFQGMDGFAEAVREYEKQHKSFGNQFRFSRKDYNVFGTTFWLGKMNDVFFLGQKKENEPNEFLFFDSKKQIQLYFKREFKDIDRSWLSFWMQEVESFQ